MGYSVSAVFSLKSLSILSVMAKPPTTLKVAVMMASAPKHLFSNRGLHRKENQRT